MTKTKVTKNDVIKSVDVEILIAENIMSEFEPSLTYNPFLRRYRISFINSYGKNNTLVYFDKDYETSVDKAIEDYNEINV